MNFFAHGIRFTDRPYFLAGTAVPDWLSAADRGVRLRPRHVEPFADGSPTVEAELAAGVWQHLEDDRRFHRSRAFVETTAEVGQQFRALLGREDGFRTGFLGHVATEMLLDAILIERHPQKLEAYYRAVDRLDDDEIQRVVNTMAPRSTHQLVPWIRRFRRERFLHDYRDTTGLLFRLNQLLRRITLKPLPETAETVLQRSWTAVEERTEDLVPEEWPSGLSAA